MPRNAKAQSQGVPQRLFLHSLYCAPLYQSNRSANMKQPILLLFFSGGKVRLIERALLPDRRKVYW